MCISHLSSFILTALKVSSMIKRSVRFKCEIPTHSWRDNFHLIICFFTQTSQLTILSRAVDRLFPVCASFFKYQYVKADVWIRCFWLGSLVNRCLVIHKDRGKRWAGRYKWGRWMLASGNRSIAQETCHVRRARLQNQHRIGSSRIVLTQHGPDPKKKSDRQNSHLTSHDQVLV